jgi:nucleoside-diphosphate-sugar epimerase
VRVVVTGAAGFVGAALTSRLLDDGHDVVGVDCFLAQSYSPQVKRDRLDLLRGRPGFGFAERDLRAELIADLAADADVVVHLAGMPGLTSSWHDVDSYLGCNVLGTQRVLEAVAASGCHLVHVSSSSIYGDVLDGDEDQVPHPLSPYGVSKLAAEQLVEAYRRTRGLSATVLRLFSVYGPGQRPDMAYSVFCERLLDGRPVEIAGDGLQSRSNTYLDDAVDALVRAATIRPDGAILNVAGSEAITVLDALRILAAALSVEVDLVHVPGRAGDQRVTRTRAARAFDVLGWRPATAVNDGLARQALSAQLARAQGVDEAEPLTMLTT